MHAVWQVYASPLSNALTLYRTVHGRTGPARILHIDGAYMLTTLTFGWKLAWRLVHHTVDQDAYHALGLQCVWDAWMAAMQLVPVLMVNSDELAQHIANKGCEHH